MMMSFSECLAPPPPPSLSIMPITYQNFSHYGLVGGLMVYGLMINFRIFVLSEVEKTSKSFFVNLLHF